MTQLRTLRKKFGMTLVEVSKRLETDPGNLSRIETGKQGLTVSMARKLAGLYSVSVDQIVGGPVDNEAA